MRKIKLRTVEIGQVAGRDVPAFKFAEGIKGLMEIKEGGLKLEELRQCLRISHQVDAATKAPRGYVLLEDKDWQYVSKRLHEHVFPFAVDAFEQLADAVEQAEVFDPNAAADASTATEDDGETVVEMKQGRRARKVAS